MTINGKLRFVPGGLKAEAGVRVIIPDGRRGVLAKWPTITEDGLVRVDLDEGGCYICRLIELEIDQRFSTQFHHPGHAHNLGGQLAELEPE